MLKTISLSNIKSFSTESLTECEIASLLKKLIELKQKFASKQDYRAAGFIVMLEKLNGCKKPISLKLFSCIKEFNVSNTLVLYFTLSSSEPFFSMTNLLSSSLT